MIPRVIVYKLSVLDRNTWNHITVCKQIIKDRYVQSLKKMQQNTENIYSYDYNQTFTN